MENGTRSDTGYSLVLIFWECRESNLGPLLWEAIMLHLCYAAPYKWKTLVVFFTAADEGQGSQNNRSWRFGEHFFFFLFSSPLSLLRPGPRLVETFKEEDSKLPQRWSCGPTKHLTLKYLIFSTKHLTEVCPLQGGSIWPLERVQLCGSIEMAKIQEGRNENDY